MIKEGILFINQEGVDTPDVIYLNNDIEINDLEIQISIDSSKLNSVTVRCYLSEPNINGSFIPFIDITYPNLKILEKINGNYILPLDSEYEKALDSEYLPRTNKIILMHEKSLSKEYKCKLLIHLKD